MSGDLVFIVKGEIGDALMRGDDPARAAIKAVAEWIDEHHQIDKDGSVHLALTWQYTRRPEGSK